MMSTYSNNTISFRREWAMPNSQTFSIPCINTLVRKHTSGKGVVIDPFANHSKIATITNDLSEEYDTDHHMDALDFLKMFNDNSVDVVLYDPPYSLRQVSECYKSVGIEVTTETTQSSWRTKHINEISRIVKQGGLVLSFGWNSSGVGIKRWFDIIEILLVAHGGSHNDTICTVERKQSTLF
jgi:hypothetical protein